MAIKKITLLAFTLLSLKDAVFAQTDWGWDWKDSSKVAVKDKPQFNQFLNNQFPYPAKPSSQGELGFSLGYSQIFGDITAKPGIGLGVSWRKALNHTFSYRWGFNGSLNVGEASAAQKRIGGADYRNAQYSLSFDILSSLNTASHYRGNPKTNVYVVSGLSLIATNTHKRSATGQYQTMTSPGGSDFPATEDFLFGITFGGKDKRSWGILPALNLGGGIAFKLDNKINLAIEQKFSLVNYDFLDAFGSAYPTYVPPTPAVSSKAKDVISFTSVRLNINLGDESKKIQPLWWINPNNFVYNELNTPKHMKLPKVVLPDADKDGVTDQFDLQPNTPAGAPVDSHGVAKDTDGDGVLDYKDKEPLTSQKCFPVNNDGIGSCPESACCKEIKDLLASGAFVKQSDKKEVLTNLPTIQFKNKSSKLTKQDEELISSIAKKLNENPDAKIKLIGYGASSKAAQQLSWERVNAVKKHLVEKLGISENRIIFTYGLEGDANTVDIQGTTEEGPSTVPAPHPNLKGAAKATSRKR